MEIELEEFRSKLAEICESLASDKFDKKDKWLEGARLVCDGIRTLEKIGTTTIEQYPDLRQTRNYIWGQYRVYIDGEKSNHYTRRLLMLTAASLK